MESTAAEYARTPAMRKNARAEKDWCGSNLVSIRLTGPYNTGKIDIIYVPDYTYTSNAQFVTDATFLVKNSYAKIWNVSDNTIPADYFNKFNFYCSLNR